MHGARHFDRAARGVGTLIVLLALGCGEASDGAADTHDGQADIPDIVGLDAAPTPVEAQDEAALTALLAWRQASSNLSATAWPTLQAWPGFALHAVPMYVVAIDVKGKPRRGYLIGGTLPNDAVAAAAPFEGVARWDAGVEDVWIGLEAASEFDVAGASRLLVGIRDGDGVREDDAPDLAFAERVVDAYMTRLREVEAGWAAVQACGQADYPRVAEAIALLFLEAAVLDEALAATGKAEREGFLHDWASIRAAAVDASNLVGQRFRHYDNTVASARFAMLRVVAAAELAGMDWIRAQHAAALGLPYATTPTEFDDWMFENADLGAAALEVAAWVSIDVQKTYEQADTVHSALLAHFGGADPKRVAAAKTRHPFADYQARAAIIAALPTSDFGFEP